MLATAGGRTAADLAATQAALASARGELRGRQELTTALRRVGRGLGRAKDLPGPGVGPTGGFVNAVT